MPLPSIDEVYCGLLGSVTAGLYNYNSRRPVFSRLPLHALCIGLGYAVGKGLSMYKADRILRREVWLWDYVNSHPEDFPELKQDVKYKNVFQEWAPIR